MSFLSQLSTFGLEEFSNDPNKKYQNAMFANGLWQKRQEPVGEFVVKVENIDGKLQVKYGDFEMHVPLSHGSESEDTTEGAA